MIAQLTRNERQTALLILLTVAIGGLAMAIGGRDNLLGVHGAIASVLAILMMFVVIGGYYAPEPTEDRTASYYDDPTKVGIVVAMLWAVVGMAVGHRRARGWAHAPGARGRVGRYLAHDEIGAGLLGSAGSEPLPVAWAREHHLPADRWTVPAEVGAALRAADDD